MCVVDRSGSDALDPLEGFKIHVAEDGKGLPQKQMEENWAYGGMPYWEAYNRPDLKGSRGMGVSGTRSQRALGNLGPTALRIHRNKMRQEWVPSTDNPYINPGTGTTQTSWNQGSQASEKYG